MSEEKSLTVWGEQSEIVALGERLKVMLPNGNALSPEHAHALAQYSRLADANPFRGEIYAYEDKDGKLIFVEGYKLLIRWAKRVCNYTDSYEEWDEQRKVNSGLSKDDIAYTCYVLRDDQRKIIKEFVDLGAAFKEAYGMVAYSATGVVSLSDRQGKNRQTQQTWNIPAPKGWTWHDVAKKRALKNALNLSHGAPSPTDISKESWMVDDTETVASDWSTATVEMDDEIRERLAKLEAVNRKREEVVDALPPGELHTITQENVNLLRGRKDEPGIGDDYKDSTEGQVIEEEDPFPAGPPAVEAVSVPAEPGLVEAAQELGGVAVAVDAPPPDPRVYTVDEARQVILTCGYKSEEAVGLAVKSLIGKLAPVDEQGQVTDKTNLTALTETELWNFTQYAQRRAILNDVNLPIEVRLQRVPEIESSINKPTTVKAAGEFMHNLLKMLNTNGQKMKRLQENG